MLRKPSSLFLAASCAELISALISSLRVTNLDIWMRSMRRSRSNLVGGRSEWFPWGAYALASLIFVREELLKAPLMLLKANVGAQKTLSQRHVL